MKQPRLNPTRGIRGFSLSLLTCLMAGCANLGGSQGLTDGAVDADLQGYETQQLAIKTLNDSSEHRVASYSLAKAQCWLDVSYHEYSRNDRSDFVPAALRESERITNYLADGGAVDGVDNPANVTLLVNGAAQLRQDLWDAAASLKQNPGIECASQQVACAEVELVHAGNEYNQQGWRHAKPYVQIAEDLIGEAYAAADSCVVNSPGRAEIKQQSKGSAIDTPTTMLVNVLFKFDKYTLDQTHPGSLEQLQRMVSVLQSGDYRSASLALTGHADRSNNTGDPNYNQLLSQRRANSVLRYLESRGVDVREVTVSHEGDAIQVSQCEQQNRSRAEFEACLLPNRRVELKLTLMPN